MSARLTREDVERVIAEARAAGERPDLSGRDLSWLDLSWLHLGGANLTGTILWGANLTGTYLGGANLTDAILWDANLTNGRGGDLLVVEGLPSGRAILVPTPRGWRIAVGCWGPEPLDDLWALVSRDEGWPVARGAEVARRRPSLLALIALAEAHIALHPDTVPALAEHWGVAA